MAEKQDHWRPRDFPGNTPAILQEALTEGLILRLILRTEEGREVAVGLPRMMDARVLVIRDLADHSRRRLDISEISAVDVIGVYLENYDEESLVEREESVQVNGRSYTRHPDGLPGWNRWQEGGV